MVVLTSVINLINYTEDELDEIDNTHLTLSLQGNESGDINTSVYLSRLTKIYDIYRYLLCRLYNETYHTISSPLIRTSNITIGIHYNFAGISLMIDADDIAFKQRILTFFHQNIIYYTEMITDSLYINWENIEIIHSSIFEQDFI